MQRELVCLSLVVHFLIHLNWSKFGSFKRSQEIFVLRVNKLNQETSNSHLNVNSPYEMSQIPQRTDSFRKHSNRALEAAVERIPAGAVTCMLAFVLNGFHDE